MNNSVILSPELIIFGGTFDPPHRGHQDCIQSIQKLFPQAEILLIPSFHPPLNATDLKNPLASFDHRLAMCRIAFRNFLPASNVLDLERSLPSPSYTSATLGYLSHKYPTLRISWVLGLDQFLNFHRWHEPLKILRMASLLILPREDQDLEKALTAFKENLGLKISQISPDSYLIKTCQTLTFIRQNTSPATSRIIRDCLLRKQQPPVGWLSPELSRYILAENLYST